MEIKDKRKPKLTNTFETKERLHQQAWLDFNCQFLRNMQCLLRLQACFSSVIVYHHYDIVAGTDLVYVMVRLMPHMHFLQNKKSRYISCWDLGNNYVINRVKKLKVKEIERNKKSKKGEEKKL